MAENTPRKIVSSFNLAQLRQVGSELVGITAGLPDGPISWSLVKELIDAQPMDEKGRKRLEVGFALLAYLSRSGKSLDEVRQALVWQIGL